MRRRLMNKSGDDTPPTPPSVGIIEVRIGVTTATDFGNYFNYDLKFTSLNGSATVNGYEINENIPYQNSLDQYANSYIDLLTNGNVMKIKIEFLDENNYALGSHIVYIDDSSQSIRTATMYLDKTSMTFNQDW